MGRRRPDDRRGLRGRKRKAGTRPQIALATLLALTACAGRSTRNGGDTEPGGAGPGAAGAAAGTSGTGGASAGRTGEDACAPLGNDPTHAPARKGCYAFDDGGWVRIPCECELPIENPTERPVAVELALVTTLDGAPLTFTPETSVEISVDDLDGRYLATWSSQPGHEDAFGVSRSDSQTHVTLRAARVMLGRVSLNPCEARYTQAKVLGPDSLTLSVTMNVVATDGVVLPWSGDCSPIDPPPRP
jgi:hypothetical protein